MKSIEPTSIIRSRNYMIAKMQKEFRKEAISSGDTTETLFPKN